MADETITKRQLCERIAKMTGHTQVAAKEIVQAFLDQIIDELAKGNRMEFRNFGVFDTRRQAPRRARNPRTDEVVYVPAKAVVAFKVGKQMTQKVQANLRRLEHETQQ